MSLGWISSYRLQTMWMNEWMNSLCVCRTVWIATATWVGRRTEAVMRRQASAVVDLTSPVASVLSRTPATTYRALTPCLSGRQPRRVRLTPLTVTRSRAPTSTSSLSTTSPSLYRNPTSPGTCRKLKKNVKRASSSRTSVYYRWLIF